MIFRINCATGLLGPLLVAGLLSSIAAACSSSDSAADPAGGGGYAGTGGTTDGGNADTGLGGAAGSGGSSTDSGNGDSSPSDSTAGDGPLPGSWLCTQVGEACGCQPVVPSLAGDTCKTPKPPCCFVYQAPTGLSCQCQPTTAISCPDWLSQLKADAVSTCPPP